MVTFSEDELIHRIYGDINHLPISPYPIDYFLDHAILTPRNVDVQATNDKILKRMPGHEIIFHSADRLESDEDGIYNDVPEEFLRTINPASLLLSELKMTVVDSFPTTVIAPHSGNASKNSHPATGFFSSFVYLLSRPVPPP